MTIVINTLISSILIGLVTWISKTKPSFAGFVISIPLSSMIALALTNLQSTDSNNSFALAKGIFTAVPATLVFFIPFLIAPKFNIPFWVAYGLGIFLLIIGYFIHKNLT